MARRLTPGGLGLEGRVLALLAAGTVAATVLGYAAAAALDGGSRPVAAARIAPPLPSPGPEVEENTPVALPAVPDPAAAPGPGPAPEVVAPAPTPPAPSESPSATPQPAATPSRTTPTTPPAVAPEPEPPNESAPRSPPDDGRSLPANPAPPSAPLATFAIAPAEMPATDGDARARLAAAARRPGATTATRTDIAYVLRLDRAFRDARLPGRRAAVSRMLRVNAWWYARRGAPARRSLVRDPDGLIYTYRPAHGLAFNPVGTAGRWQGLNDSYPSTRLASVLLDTGVADVRAGHRTLTWEYFDVPGAPAAIRPTASGMAQARIARLMAGAYRDSGDARYLEGVRDALAALDVDVADGGVRSVVAERAGGDPAPWYVERAYPGDDPWMGAALNGFMVALLELRATGDALAGAADPAAAGVAADARRLADAGAASLDRFLPLHDAGNWSYYGLLSPGHPWRTYQANVTYHCYHVTLLRSLAARYPDATFARYADRWDADATRAGVTCG